MTIIYRQLGKEEVLEKIADGSIEECFYESDKQTADLGMISATRILGSVKRANINICNWNMYKFFIREEK